MNIPYRIALVTGASAGIGAEFCRQLAPRCEKIIAVGRREDRLAALAGELATEVELVPVVADLAGVEGITRTLEALRQQGPVDTLVNNAGFSTFGAFADSDIDRELAMLRLHLDATMELTRGALPFMREAGGGRIVNLGSVGALIPMHNTAVYGATKAFLLQFSQSLQQEVASQGIAVQCLCPGLTRTEIHDQPEFAGFDKARMPEELWMEAPAVVTASLAALDAMDAGTGGKPDPAATVVVPGAINRQLLADALRDLRQSIQQQAF